MKILFAGPTLFGEVESGALRQAPDILCPGPAGQSDIARAVLDGATSIGLIDGRYEDVASPWHKEILFALSRGVRMFGAASLGALRAAECAPFGMVGIGEIFERYRSGELIDDSDVAQLHAPAELSYLPLTEALVNVEATLRKLARDGEIDPQVSAQLEAAARGIFFKDLTYDAVLARSGLGVSELDALAATIARGKVDLKRLDAQRLVEVMIAQPDVRQVEGYDWRMATPVTWRRFMRALEAAHAQLPESSPATAPASRTSA
jgi:hypothetical protein